LNTTQQAEAYPFLRGGGEMGERTRNYDWSQTPVGSPDRWPQALRTTVSTLLRSAFPMFLWWGEEMTQFYNDAYRPSLGNAGKHPAALGGSGPEFWPEIWPTIYPLIEQVRRSGDPTFMEDQLIPIYRNGSLEDVYWTFSYSLVLRDDGGPGGILVTCLETTATVLGRLALEESEQRFRNLVEQAPVAMAVTHGDDFVFDNINPPMLRMINKQDKGAVLGRPLGEVLPELPGQPVFEHLRAVLRSGNKFSGTEVEVELVNGSIRERRFFNITYSRVVNKDGTASVLHMASDVTDQVLARRKTEESEVKLRSILNSAPTAMGVFVGPDLVMENPNSLMIDVMAAGPDIEGKSFRKLLPGLVEEEKKFIGIIDTVRATGEPFEAREVAVFFKAEKRTRYFNINFIPLRDESGSVYAVLDVSVDVTEQVLARKKIEAGEQDLRTLALQSPVGICVLDAATLVSQIANNAFVEIAGQPLEAIVGKRYWDTFAEAKPYYEEALSRVVREGIAFYADEVQVPLIRQGRREVVHVTFVYEPMKDSAGTVQKVAVWVLDNTPQVLARKKIEESEGRFRLLADASPNLVWMLKSDGTYEYVNKTTLDFLGITQEQMAIGWVPFLHPDDVQPVTQAITKAVQNQQPYQMEHRLRDRNGQYRWVLSQALPAYDADGNVFAYVGSSIDIHAAKIDRQALVESEARFRALADDSPVFVFMIDKDPLAPVSYWNKTWLTYTGQTYEEAIGTSWNGILHEDDIPVVMAHYSPALEKGAPYFIPAVRVRRKDGEYRWHAFKGNPRTLANGDFNGYVGMGFDIHEQKLAQQKLETALEQARLSKEAAELGTFDMDLKQKTMHWDDRCRFLFGISHKGPVSFTDDFIKRLHPDDQERVMAVIDRSFNKAASNGDYDVEYRTIGAEDGIERWVRAKGKVYFDEKETPVRFIGSVLDITAQMTALQQIERTVEVRTRELAQANETLQVINKELQRSNQNLEEFAHAASHDLKEPVRKIHFFTNQLKDLLSKHLNEAEARSFGRIENATRRMGNLIDDLLLYSHVSQRPHEKESVDLNEKVLRVLDDLELDISEKRAQVSVGALPVVAGYRRQLQQLFQNLVSNALKYSKAGVPPEIAISAEQSERDGHDYHLIKVSDNGIGIAAEYADKIFQMFTRLHGKNEYSGTGVGLSIVKKVVENHQGFVGVSSKPGVGSVFEIYLPV
jgi:PAS domain S-box-containing protein